MASFLAEATPISQCMRKPILFSVCNTTTTMIFTLCPFYLFVCVSIAALQTMAALETMDGTMGFPPSRSFLEMTGTCLLFVFSLSSRCSGDRERLPTPAVRCRPRYALNSSPCFAMMTRITNDFPFFKKKSIETSDNYSVVLGH